MRTALLLALFAAQTAPAAEGGWPLPEAPVRLVIPDAAAFDAALTGSFRAALQGQLAEDDTLARAWRQTQVGSKLEDQWQRLSGDLPWTWDEIHKLRPRSLGLALLQVGQLEAVLLIETPLSVLPVPLPPGELRGHQGASYHMVVPGAADGSSDVERRLGLGWAQTGGFLVLATSERALKLTLEAQAAGKRFAAPLPGLVSLDLDLQALRKDRYFRREFPWAEGPEQGHLRAALRLEQGQLVEVREGSAAALPPGAEFEAQGAAAGWESTAASLWPALRAALLEPMPKLEDKPVLGLAALPGTKRGEAEDRYLVSLEKPAAAPGETHWEAGELSEWQQLLERQQPAGWGFLVDPDGTRRIVFAWPEARDAELEKLCRATVERRAGRSSVVALSGAREIQVGPALPALALKRAGAYIWLGPSAQALASVPTPRPAADLVRWGRVDLGAVRAEGQRWARVEGPGSPEQVRPFSDRLLGLIAWLPRTRALSVERRQKGEQWSEQVVFQADRP